MNLQILACWHTVRHISDINHNAHDDCVTKNSNVSLLYLKTEAKKTFSLELWPYILHTAINRTHMQVTTRQESVEAPVRCESTLLLNISPEAHIKHDYPQYSLVREPVDVGTAHLLAATHSLLPALPAKG